MTSQGGTRSRIAHVLAVALVAASTAVAVTTATTAPAAAAPTGCEGYEFADSFNGVPSDIVNGSHRYALNSRLESRQSGGGALATYGRRSGTRSTSTPPSDNHVQVGQPYSAPNALSFWLDPAAVRLDTAIAPAPAPAAPEYVAKAKLDPIAGNTTSTEWLSVMLSSTRNSDASIFDPNVNVGLYVRSNGQFGIYEAGALRSPQWSANATGTYAVTLKVNQSTRLVTVTVNEVTQTVTLANTVPAAAYLYLGSYFATAGSSYRSTVDDLCVQTMNMFSDSFNSASTAASSNDYLLNTDLDGRQQLASQMSYTRSYGAADRAQVNRSGVPDVLSFRGGRATVRLDAPAAADPVTNKFRISATLDPVTGDTLSGDWVGLNLAGVKNSTGYVTDADVDFGFFIRSNGEMAVVQRGVGVPVVPSDPAFPRAPLGSGAFSVTLTVGTAAGSTATIVANGKTYTAALVSPVPALSYLYTGAYMASGSTQTSTVNDLRLNRITRYYGYYGAVWPSGSQLNDNLASTYPPTVGKAGDYNLNIVHLRTSATYSLTHQDTVDAILSNCRIAGCVIVTGDVFFESTTINGEPKKRLRPSADYLARWNTMVKYLTDSETSDGGRGLDRIMGFGLEDEPYLTDKDIPQDELATSTDVIKCIVSAPDVPVCAQPEGTTFRTTAVVVEFNAGNMPNTTTRKIPANADIVGFDWYCPGSTQLDWNTTQRTYISDTLTDLKAVRSDPAQRLFAIAEARTGSQCSEYWPDADHGDSYFEQTASEYNELTLVEPGASGVMSFGLWLAFTCKPDVPASQCPPTQPYTATPDTYPWTWETMHRIGRATVLQGTP